LKRNQYGFKKGDILLFKPGAGEQGTGHAGIVYDIGKDGKTIKMIHSAIVGWNQNAPDGVQITNDIWEEQTPGVYNSYWLNNYEGYIPYESLLTKKK
jgi:hypothetical protein